LRVGDELINVCGKRLRGLDIDDAIRTLKQQTRELDIVISRDVNVDDEDKEEETKEQQQTQQQQLQHQQQRSKTPNFEHSKAATSNFEQSKQFESSNRRSSKKEDRNFDETVSLFSEQRVRDEHRRIAQKLHDLGSSSSSLCDYQTRSNYGSYNNSNSPKVPPKPYVSRTYIGGSASSSLAMKIHRKNLQLRSDPPMTSSVHHGSLSSLHETR
jgi:hypothetical protein